MRVDVERDGVRLAVWEDGPAGAPALVLAHALGADHRMWDEQAAAFSGSWRVIRYDCRGHGASSVPPGDYSIEALGRDVLAILDARGVESAAFCGLSIGGMVGQWLGAHAGARFDRLVLANTTAYAGPEIWAPRVLAARRDGMAGLVEPTLERWFTADFRAHDPAAVDRVRQVLSATPPEGYAGCAVAIRDMDQRPTAAAITPPTLVIYGEKDMAAPPARSHELAGAIPGSRLVALDAAHLSNMEQPGGFNRALTSFLEGR